MNLNASAFNIPLKDKSVNMIITSPPFFYGIPMPDAHTTLRNPMFGLEASSTDYRDRMRTVLCEMKRVCNGPIWVHTSRPDLVWDQQVTKCKTWVYSDSDVLTFWLGWRVHQSSFEGEGEGWFEEPIYKDGHWGVFPDKMIWEMIKEHGVYHPFKILDPFSGTGVVGRVAEKAGYIGINMDINLQDLL